MKAPARSVPCTACLTISKSLSGEVGVLSDLENLEALALLDRPEDDLDEKKLNERPMSRLVHLFLRKVEMRGSDVRLDSSTVFKAGALARTSIDPTSGNGKSVGPFVGSALSTSIASSCKQCCVASGASSTVLPVLTLSQQTTRLMRPPGDRRD